MILKKTIIVTGAASGMSRAALDLTGTGVRINEVRPGETNTAMLASELGYEMSMQNGIPLTDKR
jgi:NAD(P)-dependent dehydrogenase (short-subunit alcohol dehydrogenase family)